MIYAFSNPKDNHKEQEQLYLHHFLHNPPRNNKVIRVYVLSEWINIGKPGDTFIAPDFSSLSQNPTEILLALSLLLNQKKRVIILKQQYEFKNNEQNLVLAKAFQIAAEITKGTINFYEPKEKNAPIKKGKAGRPKGSKSINKKLANNHDDIKNALQYGVKISTLSKRYGVTRNTVRKYIIENIPEELRPKNKPPRI